MTTSINYTTCGLKVCGFTGYESGSGFFNVVFLKIALPGQMGLLLLCITYVPIKRKIASPSRVEDYPKRQLMSILRMKATWLWIIPRLSFVGQIVKKFFPQSSEKWLWKRQRAKMALTAGSTSTLSKPSRCPNYGVHPTN
jgi:hypothetical protein